ncbi:MAG: endonuclease III, partial [Oscillospiraceae bacterium]
LPGVGRKTANLVLGDVYGSPAVVCDTHCIRITNLLGLSTSKNPLKTEKELRECLPLDKASDFCHRLVLHGRAVCVARKPKCDLCVLNGICAHALEMAKPL